jgi:hypothetical protein
LNQPLAGGDHVPLSLALLHLGSAADEAIRVCRAASIRSPKLDAELVAMLDQDDWRVHLPAAVVIGLGHRNEEIVAALWQAFDRGSWVMPQLAAVAYLCDPHFEVPARGRIEQRCPLDSGRLDALEPLRRHVVAGPAGSRARSAKGLSSLIELCGLHWGWSRWLRPLVDDPEVQQFLVADFDHGNQIVSRWLNRYLELTGAQAIGGKAQPDGPQK